MLQQSDPHSAAPSELSPQTPCPPSDHHPPQPPPQLSLNGHVDYGPPGAPVAVPVSVHGLVPGNPVDLSSPTNRHPLDPHDRRHQQYKQQHHTLQPIGTILHNLGKHLFHFHSPRGTLLIKTKHTHFHLRN